MISFSLEQVLIYGIGGLIVLLIVGFGLTLGGKLANQLIKSITGLKGKN